MVQFLHLYMTTWKKHSFDYTDLCQQMISLLFNILFRFVIVFLPRIKCLLISWPQLPSTVILEPKKIKFVTASTFSPSICHEVVGPDAMILVFWMLFQASSLLLPSSKGFLVPLHFLPLEWYQPHIWGVDISPSSLDSSLWLSQPSISHDVHCILVK